MFSRAYSRKQVREIMDDENKSRFLSDFLKKCMREYNTRNYELRGRRKGSENLKK